MAHFYWFGDLVREAGEEIHIQKERERERQGMEIKGVIAIVDRQAGRQVYRYGGMLISISVINEHIFIIKAIPQSWFNIIKLMCINNQTIILLLLLLLVVVVKRSIGFGTRVCVCGKTS